VHNQFIDGIGIRLVEPLLDKMLFPLHLGHSLPSPQSWHTPLNISELYSPSYPHSLHIIFGVVIFINPKQQSCQKVGEFSFHTF